MKVIYHEFNNQYKIQIVDYLYVKHAWLPVFLSGHHATAMSQWRDSHHPNCILRETMELRLAQFDYTTIGKPVPVDEEILNKLSHHALNFLGFSQDATGYNYSFLERKRFYYDILTFWNTVIVNTNPDIFVSFTWPHTTTCLGCIKTGFSAARFLDLSVLRNLFQGSLKCPIHGSRAELSGHLSLILEVFLFFSKLFLFQLDTAQFYRFLDLLLEHFIAFSALPLLKIQFLLTLDQGANSRGPNLSQKGHF
jgi:hypothetical protein